MPHRDYDLSVTSRVFQGSARSILATACLAVLSGGFDSSAVESNSATVESVPDSRPNIIVIMADDIGYECLSCNGCQDYKTPHLDRLAAGGIRFNHCYAQPICTPSRVEIMTGQYNFRNYERFGLLRGDQFTFGNLLRDAGYATCIVGKWQLDGDASTVAHFGFDRHCLWHIMGRKSRYWNPRIVRDGNVMPGLEQAYGPDVIATYAMEFMEANRSRPFFLYYPAMLTHFPYVPTPDSPAGGQRDRSGKHDGKRGGEEYFDDMVIYLDKVVGRLVAKLDELQLREKTLILFTGDNGCTENIVTQWRNEQIRGGKGTLPDAGTHVALIANWPGHTPIGSVSDALVDFTDFVPTVAAAAGVPLRTDQDYDGVSFLPVILGESRGVREWIYCHYRRNEIPGAPRDADRRRELIASEAAAREAKLLGRFARTAQYKLYDDGRFYDVAADSLETNELPPSRRSGEAIAAHRMLQAVHLSMPSWQSFAE